MALSRGKCDALSESWYTQADLVLPSEKNIWGDDDDDDDDDSVRFRCSWHIWYGPLERENRIQGDTGASPWLFLE